MHELGLVYQVVKTIDEVVADQGLTEVSEINLLVGEMTDVVPRFIEEAWQAAKSTTSYPNAIMNVEVVEGKARCNACGFEGLVRNIDFECPKCHSTNLSVIAGREFEIKNIVAK